MTTPALPARSALASHWTLDSDVVFLNHGSFGATPRVVLEAQNELRARLEREPVRFMMRELEPLLDASREALAGFVGCAPSLLAFVTNATTGVNTVLRSLHFEPGDELLTTNHEYNACKNALDFVAAASGARVVVARIPFPIATEDDIVRAIEAKITPKTRLLLIDHVTSPTGMVLPLEAIALVAHAKNVDVLVDGAHAPGMVPVNLSRLGVAYYTANCHKWMCAPKGVGMLYVREDKQSLVRPLTISHGANSPRAGRSKYWLEMDWVGTSDPTAALCVKNALEFMNGLVSGGFARVMQMNRALAIQARAILCDALSVSAPCPESMVGSMAAVPLVDRKSAGSSSTFIAEPLQDALLERHAIEVPIVPWPRPPQRLVRISAQVYNSRAEYTYLAKALRDELSRE